MSVAAAPRYGVQPAVIYTTPKEMVIQEKEKKNYLKGRPDCCVHILIVHSVWHFFEDVQVQILADKLACLVQRYGHHGQSWALELHW